MVGGFSEPDFCDTNAWRAPRPMQAARPLCPWPLPSTGWTLQQTAIPRATGDYLGAASSSATNSLPSGNLFFRLHHLFEAREL